jgi:hypothetical protein
MPRDTHYWFPAKRYGWGWGLPSRWQGWVVLIAFFALLLGGLAFFPPRSESVAYVVYAAVLSVVLVAICWITGEPPKWRWGK